jgi:1,4-alpha-glucan branching enzyme
MVNRLYIKCLMILLLSFAAQLLDAQQKSKVFVEDGRIFIRVDFDISKKSLDSLITAFDLQETGILQALRYGETDSLKNSGWSLFSITSQYLIVSRKLEELSKVEAFEKKFWLSENVWPDKPGAVNDYYVRFGYNQFKNRSVWDGKGEETIFVLKGHQQANRVYLSGSFNDWSTLRSPMTRTDSGWVVKAYLKPGKHLYKFIVDGKWISDLMNEQNESDGYLGRNSIYFKCNHRFMLHGNLSAKRVLVSGSFNNWSTREARLMKTQTGWNLPVYLQQGSYEYRFVVDGRWIADPTNTQIVKNEFGEDNSFLSIGKKTEFYLDGYPDAKEVFLAGAFNNWRPNIAMQRSGKGWKVDYAIKPGNYHFKYVVDGNWVFDPLADDVVQYHANDIQSIRFIEPNYTFRLNDYADAKEVLVTGSFNNWDEKTFSMQKDAQGWYLSLFLPPGKVLYKFIVDGQWITDPKAIQNEKNQHGTYNSVLLMKR